MNKQKIYKVTRIYDANPDNNKKYVFLGNYYDKSIQKLLSKLEKVGYNGLNKSEFSKINSFIPNFKLRIGKIDNGTTFCYGSIYENDSINQIRVKIAHFLRIHPSQQHLWIRGRNASLSIFVNFLNSAFLNSKEITTQHLITRLQIMCDCGTPEELYDIIYKHLPKKYEGKVIPNLFRKPLHTYERLLNDEELKILIHNSYHVLGSSYLKIKHDETHYLSVVSNPFSPNNHLSDEVIIANTNDQILLNYGLIEQNTIYVVSSDDFINNYKGNNKDKISYYYWEDIAFTIDKQEITKQNAQYSKMVEDSIGIEKNLVNVLNKKDNAIFKPLQLTSCIITLNNPLQPEVLDLDKIFNLYQTSATIPFIKLVHDEDLTTYKIHKPFLKKHSLKLKMIISWKSDKFNTIIEYPTTKKYLVFKLLVNFENYLSVMVFDNAYVVVEFNFSSNETYSFSDVRSQIELLEPLINLIKKVNKNVSLKLPEIRLLFNPDLAKDVVRSKISVFSIRQIISLDYDLPLKKLAERINLLHPFFYGYLKDNVLNVIYKKVNNFDGVTSINNFILKVMEKNKKDIYHSWKKYVEMVASIFLISEENADTYLQSMMNSKQVDELSPFDKLGESSKYHFLYGLTISIHRDQFDLEILADHVQNIRQVEVLERFLRVLVSSEFDQEFNKVEEADFDLEFDRNMGEKIVEQPGSDVMFDFEEFGLDIDDILIDNDNDVSNQKKSVSKEDEIDSKIKGQVVLETNIKKKGATGNKIKFTTYMTQMREKADPDLYKVEELGNLDEAGKKGHGWKYSRACDATQMRQPYILNKEKFEKLDKKDKEAVSGYLKYRGNYYICPRIWDYKADKPISIKDFIANDMKSPYTQGEALPADKRNKEFLGDKYTVIIRKPTTSNYWKDDKVEKDWPEELQGTGAEAFPGLLKPKNHPKGKCIPCCFSKPPEDYNPLAKELQNFKKPVGFENCEMENKDSDQLKTSSTDIIDDDVICQNERNENYVKMDSAILNNCRYGQLPENLNLLLKNHQELFINTSNGLVENASCFLRRGVVSDKHSFLRSIASIKGCSYRKLISLIMENLTPYLFLTLNRGSLTQLFRDQNNLPKNRGQLHGFLDFIKKNHDFVEWFGLKGIKITSGQDIINLEKKRLKLRKVKRLYTFYSAFHNYLGYLSDHKVIKRYELVIDLCRRSNKWLFPEGVNILIFNKENDQMFCNPYVKDCFDEQPSIFLVYDRSGKFEPIFYVEFRNRNIISKGVFNTKDINLSSKSLLYHKNSNSANIELLKDCQKRNMILKRLLELHYSNCAEIINLEYKSGYEILPVTFKFKIILKQLDIDWNKIVGQIVNSYSQAIYIILKNGTVIPLRPSSVDLNYDVYDLTEYFDLNISRGWNQIAHLFELNEKLKKNHLNKTQYKYHLGITGALVVEDDSSNPDVNALITYGGGLIPIEPCPLSKIKTVHEKLYGPNKLSVQTKPLYLEADYRIYDNKEFSDRRVEKLEEYDQIENLYQHFKYEFSELLHSPDYKTYLIQLQKIFNDSEGNKNIYQVLEKLKHEVIKVSDILTIPDQHINPKLKATKKKNKAKYFLAKCHKLTARKCHQHIFCDYHAGFHKKKCRINIGVKLKPLFLNRLVEELARNKFERRNILSGSYVPYFYRDNKLVIHDNELFLTNNNFYLIKQVYKTSKYHLEINTYDELILNDPYQQHEQILRIPFNDLSEIETLMTSSTRSDLKGFSDGSDIVPLDIRKKLKNVYATVFDKDGKYRPQYKAGPCIFPYIHGNTKQLHFECRTDKEEGQRCPVEVDKNRRAVTWGFCPADPKETRNNLGVENVIASGKNSKGKLDPGFKSGKCLFPFRYHPSYDLSWSCISTKHGSKEKWCATSVKAGKEILNDIPIAASKEDKVYQKKWQWDKLYDSDGKFDDDIFRYKTRGYCPSGADKIGNRYGITLDNFNSNKCYQTDSKGGYSKKELKEFASTVLGFPTKDLEKIKKSTLCQMIKEKVTDMRSHNKSFKKNPLDVYKKDPALCEKGEYGGGYYLSELRKMASKYFGMNPNMAKVASKPELCKYIVPILEREKNKMSQKKGQSNLKQLSKIYRKNPHYCEYGKRKGGYELKALRKMVSSFFNVDASTLRKDQLCKLIIKELENEKTATTLPSTEESATMDERSISAFRSLKSSDTDKSYRYRTKKKHLTTIKRKLKKTQKKSKIKRK